MSKKNNSLKGLLKTRTQSNRPLKIGSEIQSVLSNAVFHNTLHLPNIKSGTALVSEVVMSIDIRYANVFLFFRCDDEKKLELLQIMNENSPLFKHLLSKEMPHMRYHPEVRFYIAEEKKISSSYISFRDL